MGKGLKIALWIVVSLIAILFVVALLRPPADEAPEGSFDPVALLISWAPMLLLIGFWLLIMSKFSPAKTQELRERSERHMAEVEQKLDRIVELLEEKHTPN